MFKILLDDDHSLIITCRECIMQRSKLVGELVFLIPAVYDSILETRNCTVLLEYITPVSKHYRTEILTPSEETYENYVQYILPVDTELTAEAGNIELQLSLLATSLENGKVVERVRKTKTATIEITPMSPWSDYIPDSALSVIDQRIIKQDAQLKAFEEIVNNFNITKADNLTYNDDNNELQLMADGFPIGEKIQLKGTIDEDSLVDGLPVVEFSTSDSSDNSPSESDIIEF